MSLFSLDISLGKAKATIMVFYTLYAYNQYKYNVFFTYFIHIIDEKKIIHAGLNI